MSEWGPASRVERDGLTIWVFQPTMHRFVTLLALTDSREAIGRVDVDLSPPAWFADRSDRRQLEQDFWRARQVALAEACNTMLHKAIEARSAGKALAWSVDMEGGQLMRLIADALRGFVEQSGHPKGGEGS